MVDNELANWVRSELMAGQADELSANKERVKRFLRLTPDGSVMLNDKRVTSRTQISLYYIGAAYANAAGLRPEDSVSNREIVEKLGLPDGTVHPKIKELRDGHYIEAVKDGLHKINYARIGSLLDEADQSKSSI